MTRKPAPYEDPSAWSATVGLELANKVIAALLKHKEKVNDENYRLAFQMFMTGIIASFVAVTLREQPDQAAQIFPGIKELLQTSVANGVQTGVLNCSGEEIEYYCLIKQTPDPVNKKLC